MLTFQWAHVLKGLQTNPFPFLPCPALPRWCLSFAAGIVLFPQLTMGSQMTIFNEVKKSTDMNLDWLWMSVPQSSTSDIGNVLGPATCHLFQTCSVSSSSLAKQKRLHWYTWWVVIYHKRQPGIHICFIRSGKLLEWMGLGRGQVFHLAKSFSFLRSH